MNVATAPKGPFVPHGAGRMCPYDYRYPPSVFRRHPDIEAEAVYVVGGLYGNFAALDAIERLAKSEASPVTLVFNGDFHWFDAEPDWFDEIERRVSQHMALRGNVETEIARKDDIGAGCGCAYPEFVDDGVVRRSNEILSDLRRIATAIPGTQDRLTRLPMHLVARVGEHRVGIVHGDSHSLAGWNFGVSALDARTEGWDTLRDVSGVDIFASTHTCLAALRHFRTPQGAMTVINNGAAGMPNFRDTRYGVISRIASRPSPHRALYGIVQGSVHVDAIPVLYDHDRFTARFEKRWPQGSPAFDSYWERIVNGPSHALDRARPRA